MAAKVTKDRPSLGGREATAALPPCDGGIDFHGRDAGEINRARSLGTRQGSDQALPVSRTCRLTRALVSKRYTAISAALSDDGLGERLALDVNQLIVGIVKVSA